MDSLGYRFSFGPWNISDGADPFGPDVRQPYPHEAKYALYKKLGFDGVQFHDDDAVPGLDDLSAPEIAAKAAEVAAILRSEGLIAEFVAPRLWFADTRPFRGPRLGGIFVGSECKMEINRNKFMTSPPDFVKNPPDPKLAEKWEGDGHLAKGHVENWFDCIRSREKPNADVEIGHRTASLCHLLVIVRQVMRPLRWDPEKEQFVGDQEANALLDRPRRAGWELPTLT